ncbi:MAG TPA: NAD(P)/FAD-dependent oxidoreductase, partial [Geminicoccaceae bacterium]|nr:NAD(P)/FAD-dependent oxidoreductase [Geminicoccaceae bacterium]
MPTTSPASERPRVVIVGAGFGGLAAAKALARAPVEVTLVDRRNYHLFQPLLYQVATAALSPADIAWPIRSILRRQKNVQVLLGRVEGIDVERREVLIEDRRVGYDFLILATGARHSYFGRDDWEEIAPGLKKIDDATLIRRRVLMAFERAETSADPAERQRLLAFVVVGGGPTGVELAGAVAELARVALAEDFRTIDPREARVVLVEAGPRLLPSFPERLSAVAERALQRLGVEVKTGTAVTDCDASGVVAGGERIASRTVLWAAGVMASPAAKWLGARHDRAGRIAVAPDLSVPRASGVFAIGDTAAVAGGDGRPVPG